LKMKKDNDYINETNMNKFVCECGNKYKYKHKQSLYNHKNV